MNGKYVNILKVATVKYFKLPSKY